MKEFVHLHNHSDFSLLTASSKIPELVSAAKKLDYKYLALTDNGNLFGAISFYKECLANGIKPIIGCDFYMSKNMKEKGSLEAKVQNRLVLIAKTLKGYKNLIKLVSSAYIDGFYYKPRIDKVILERYKEDLIVLSASPLEGEIGNFIRSNKIDEAKKTALYYKELFKDDFYIELNRHNIIEEDEVNSQLIQIAREFDIKILATNNTFYIQKEDEKAHSILLSVGTKELRKKGSNSFFSTPEFYLKDQEAMAKLFEELPDSIENSLEIAHKCDEFKIEFIDPVLPEYSLPDGFKNQEEYLEHLVWKGIEYRYVNIDEEIKKRVKYELEVIMQTGYPGYFLIVWDFVDYAKNHDVPVGPGRGSGAGSIVAYALKITDVDPLKYGLFFERFLNPERISMPDFDIDFCYEGRDRVIEYVEEKYGKSNVCQIITFGTLKAKAVIRDVARVLGFEFEESDRIAKVLEGDDLEKEIKSNKALIAVKDRGGKYEELIDISIKLQNLKRHTSTHAAGVVISKEELTQYIPLAKDAKFGNITTQFTMDQLEECGLVKMDFLGLKTLTIIKHCIAFIREFEKDFDEEKIPMDDKTTFKMLANGDSSMVFQFESEGMRKIFKDTKPSSIADLAALNALYRPGPMDNIPQYTQSKTGKQKITYPHKDLESVLKETYGVIVYQEQVLQIAQVIAGFSYGKADILRKAMSKKNVKEMDKMKKEFIEGALKKAYDEKLADEIYELLKPFAGYGFNKSHALAYSVLAYKTAYLKANYKEEFLCANLSNVASNPEKLSEYLTECKKIGISVLAPEINESQKDFSVKNINGKKSIVFGLSGIKGVGESIIEEILHQRTRGKYRSFLDFLERVNLRVANKRVLENLIKCGIFDEIENNRRNLFENLDAYMTIGKTKYELNQLGQNQLFDDEQKDFSNKFEDFEDWNIFEKLESERELLGNAIKSNPAFLVQDIIKRKKYTKIINLVKNPEKSSREKEFFIAAYLVRKEEIKTKKGDLMLAGTLDDGSGFINFLIFNRAYKKEQSSLESSKFFVFKGRLSREKEDMRFIVDEVQAIDSEILNQEKKKEDLHIYIKLDQSLEENQEKLIQIERFLEKYKGDDSNVFIHFLEDKNKLYKCDNKIIYLEEDIIYNNLKEVSENIEYY